MNKPLVICTVLFGCFVFVITGLDWIVNGVLYDYGLQFQAGWYDPYSVLYFFLYQLIIASCLFISGSWLVGLWLEVFVLGCTQDLVFYLVWAKTWPVDEWTWMPFYRLFGFWRTEHQILLSIISLSIVTVIFVVFTKRSRGDEK